MICPACRAEIVEGARFCPQCAAPVAAPGASVADPLRAALEAAIGFQYQVVRLLGRGGMGAVYLAHELALDRDVAIKVLPPDRGETAEGRERFRREARTAARLTHPNIVPLHTFGEVGGLIYFVMGYVRGEPLSARLKREGRLRTEEARRVIAELAEALDYAHRQGVVHRDIKPDNVLIDADSGRPMLTDFGVAKAQGSGQTLTSTGSIVGTPHYMSPEQAAGKSDIDGRSDIYSLGVVGYQMLAGRRPFEGKTVGDVLVQHMTKEPPPLRTLIPEAPETLASGVMRCLAKDPSSRWSDGKSLREAVADVEDKEELPAKLRGLDLAVQILGGLLVLNGYGWIHSTLSLPVARNDDLYGMLRDMAAVVTLFVVATGLSARLVRGFSWRVIVRTALRQPSWWVGWYPRGLRRPGDVWDRLPPIIRLPRAALLLLGLMAVLVEAPVVISMSISASTYARTGHSSPAHSLIWGRDGQIGTGLFVAMVFVLLILSSGIAALRAWLYLRKTLGSSAEDEDVAAPLYAFTGRPFLWRKAHMAPLLLPEVGTTEAGGSPHSAEDCERAVARLARALPESLRPTGQAAADAATRLRGALARLDEEVASLAKDADPAEAERLEARLAALGVAEAGEPEGRHQMRALLSQQLDIVREQGRRLEEAGRDRVRLDGFLKSLWRETTALAAGASHAPRSGEAANRLHMLYGEIEKEVAASATTGAHERGGADVTDLPTRSR